MIALRARMSRDEGLTLTELLVTMVIMGVLVSASAALYISALRTSTGTKSRLDEVNDGRIAFSAMSRTLRTAILPSQLFDAASAESAAFIEASPLSMKFYANVDNPNNSIGPTRLSYTVTAAKELVETKQIPNQPVINNKYVYCDPAVVGCVVQRKILARGVDPTKTIFTYYDDLGFLLTGGGSGGVLSQTQMENIDALDISLVVEQPGSGGDGTTYVSRIALPNHDAVIRSEEGP